MSNIPSHIVQQIIDSSRIEEVIGEFVHLKKNGANYKGLSPFTNEKTPSFIVSPAKQIFKCFSTGVGGSVVTFLMKKENFTYPEALRWLADKYQIEIPKEKEQSAEELAYYSERESFFIINEFAKNHFHNNLTTVEEGQNIVLSYLLERKISIEFINKFQLGYCLSHGKDFYQNALQKAYNIEYCEKIGLIKPKENDFYDFFKGRIMFPIHNIHGKIAGFGGRIIGSDKKTAKYFNSPESSIYNKSEILYGLYFGKNEIIKKNECFLVEGYTDVISLHQAGIQNVVASSGTSLTKEQIKLISKYTKNITILYDGDNAGIKASFRGIDLILSANLNVKVVLFPDGEDPDSFSKRVSSDELESYIHQNSKDFIHFKADLLLADKNIDTSTKIQVVNEIIESISLIPDKISREFYSKEIANEHNLSSDTVLNEVESRVNKTQTPLQTKNEAHQFLEIEKEKLVHFNQNLNYEELELIKYLIKYGTYILEFENNNKQEKTHKSTVTEFIVNELLIDKMLFEENIHQKLLKIIVEHLDKQEILDEDFFLKHEDIEIVELASQFSIHLHSLSENWKKLKIFVSEEEENLETAVQNAIYSFKIKRVKKLLTEIDKEINLIINDEDKHDILIELLNKKMKFDQVKIRLAKEIGRTILH
ncbi:MAG: DNA primase [Flavobacteriia bacterium]|nr:DNA primase [Flavobacteriia bacterium]